MMQNQSNSFLKKYYPLILFGIGCFLFVFPFGWIGGEYAFYGSGIMGAIIVILGAITYFQKKSEYSQSLRKKVKIAAFAPVGIFIVIILVGVAMGISSALFYSSPLEKTERIDTTLLENRVVDWVNTNRIKNNVGGVNLDANLNRLAYIRSMDFARASFEKFQILSDADVNQIAQKNNIECVVDGKSFAILEYDLQMPHSKYTTIEELVDHMMNFLIQHEVEKEKVFASDVTRTGISASMNDEFLFIIQNFC